MQMEVEDELAATPLYIIDQLVTGTGNSLISGDFPGPEDHLPNGGPIRFLQVVDAADVFPRHNEDVNGCVRPDILEGHHTLTLIDKIGLFYTSNDLTESTVFNHSFSPLEPEG
jgi:hypothetical protein